MLSTLRKPRFPDHSFNLYDLSEIAMSSESDSDSSSGLVRLSSNPLPVEWEFCPRDIEFQLKIKKDDGKRARFAYTLRQGVSLPYSPDRIGDRKC